MAGSVVPCKCCWGGFSPHLYLAGRPVPPAAAPARDLLRSSVLVPELPTLMHPITQSGPARICFLYWLRAGKQRSPLGLLPGTSEPSPYLPEHVANKLPATTILAFVQWWTHQSDPSFTHRSIWE